MTYTYFTNPTVLVGTTELNKIQTELNQIQDRTYSNTGVPVGTTELDQRHDIFRYRAYQIQEYP